MSPKGNKKSSGNPHGGPAKRQANKNKNKGSGSDSSNSDHEQPIDKNNPSKRTRTLNDNSMEEDYVADSAADAGGSNTTPPQQNNSDNVSSPPPPKETVAPSAPGSTNASSADASVHAPKNKETSPLDASPDKDIMETNDTGSSPITTPTITILRRDFQAAAAPNASPEFVKKYPTNRAMIDAVNNLLLETYHSYTGRARMTGSNESKRLVIHFNSSKERDDCLSQQFVDLADLKFFLHDPQQLRTNEDLRAIQVTDIPFFIKKDDVTALFKKYGNIQSCRLYTRANAKVQQARIVYDDAQSVAHFQDKQWAIYCYSTCLRITPCSLTLEQKKSRREFVAVLSQLPPNTKDVHLAPLIRELGAMAVNIPLSLNSYKPKKWAYVTFRSQQMMDAAMEQSVAFQGGLLQWEFPKDINKLCHRCGKLGCAPTACPMNNSRGRSRTRNPVAHLKERFNIGQGNKTSSTNRARQRSRSQSKERSTSRHRNNSVNNSGRNNNSSPANLNNSKASNNPVHRPRSAERRNKDRSVSFSAAERNNSNTTNSNGHKLPLIDPNSSQIQEILSILKSLQEDMANVRARVHALELADQRMSRLEERVFGHKQDDIPAPDPSDSSGMLIDDHQRTPPYITQSNRPASSMSLSDPVLPPPIAPIPRTTIASTPIPEFADEATINKERSEIYSFQRSLDGKMNHLDASIHKLIDSISGNTSSGQANKASSD
ncbi:unnamed protein product [Rhizophagus irregularis]|nr:unnamed protein product [Rhizophagus irregularis]